MNELRCLRCDTVMDYYGVEEFQLGSAGFFTGSLNNYMAGSMELDVYTCPECGKVEFFKAEPQDGDIPRKKCPNCGEEHDFDCPKCPSCGYDYYDNEID